MGKETHGATRAGNPVRPVNYINSSSFTILSIFLNFFILKIYGYRMSLWAEHLGTIHESFTNPETLECVRQVRSMAEANWVQFASNETSNMTGHLMKYPVRVDRMGRVRSLEGSEEFPDVGGQIIGSFHGIQENLTI